MPTATGSYTPATWARALLGVIGAPVTGGNIAFLTAWAKAEGGHWGNSAAFNPLNTSRRMPGGESINSHGVKRYSSWAEGLQATAQTLRLGHYRSVLAGLRSGADPQQLVRSVLASPWGTKAFPRIGGIYNPAARDPQEVPLPLATDWAGRGTSTALPSVLNDPLFGYESPTAGGTPGAGVPAPAGVESPVPAEGESVASTPTSPGAGAADQPVIFPEDTTLGWGDLNLDPHQFQAMFPGGLPVAGGDGAGQMGGGAATGWRAKAVQLALGHLGVDYVWGGNDPGRGWDCSGMVQWVIAHSAGRRLPRVSFQQANSGRRVPLGKLRPGDLVAWDNSRRNDGADHIAIFIGNGWIVEAPRRGVPTRRRRLGANEGAWGVALDF